MFSKANSKTAIQKIGNSAARLLYPPCCPICDPVLPFRGKDICPAYEKKLPWVKEPACMKCGKPAAEKEEFCEDCLKYSHLFDCGRLSFTMA